MTIDTERISFKLQTEKDEEYHVFAACTDDVVHFLSLNVHGNTFESLASLSCVLFTADGGHISCPTNET